MEGALAIILSGCVIAAVYFWRKRDKTSGLGKGSKHHGTDTHQE